MIIALGTVLDAPLLIRVTTVSLTALLATIGVYGIVALIVRMDDAGYRLMRASGNKVFPVHMGRLLVKALPVVIRFLGLAGTLALVLVSGGILIHQLGFLNDLFPVLPAFFKEIAACLLGGLITVGLVKLLRSIRHFIKI